MVVVKQAGPKAPLNVVDMLSQFLQAMAITDADIKTQDGLRHVQLRLCQEYFNTL